MTVVCALSGGGETWIGSDTQAGSDGTRLLSVEKWAVRGEWAVGHAGNLRMTNLLREHADTVLADLDGPHEFTLRARRLMEDDGFNSDTEEGPKIWGQQFVLAHPRGVWSICTGLSVIEIPAGELWADGSGRAFALGAGHVIEDSAEARGRGALSAAILYDVGCGGDMWMHHLCEQVCPKAAVAQ